MFHVKQNKNRPGAEGRPRMRRDIRVVRGQTYTLSGFAKDKNGTAINLTGATLKWRFGPNDLSLTTKTLTPSTVAAATGEYLLTISPSDLTSIEPGFYSHQGEVTESGGTVTPILEGRLQIVKDLT